MYIACTATCLLLIMTEHTFAQKDDISDWTIYITNDNCPDYTWGFTEEQTRQSFADIVRSHLDEMKRTDEERIENRDRYNMAVIQEALCFIERYPDRKDELIQRIKEGRIYVSPYLCNSLWAFQGIESAIRTFYPARRLEKEWGISFDIAEHIEEPSLPWGVASILAGCGIRWLSNPFLSYDSTFSGLKNPPLFIFEGPDGIRIRVVMDPWASMISHYTQGARLLREQDKITGEWLPHYQQMGDAYPARAILASGTHGDISPRSGSQSRGFADTIINYNNRTDEHPMLINAVLPQFCMAIDEEHSKKPFLATLRGCFGHSWDVWPVSMAKYVSAMREGEREFLSAEALLTIASLAQSELKDETRQNRERTEWCWTMLSDHAWNGTDDNNRRHNADLRRKWAEELHLNSQSLLKQGWDEIGLINSRSDLTIFNSQSFPRTDLVRMPVKITDFRLEDFMNDFPSQIVEEDDNYFLYFISPEVPGFGLRQLKMSSLNASERRLRATTTELESPYYRLTVDPVTGGVSSLVYKPSNAQLAAGKNGRAICQTVYFDGQEHELTDVKTQVMFAGSVLARLQVTGTAEGIQVTNFITVYADLDRVDFDLRINKPVTTKEERLCQIFPVLQEGSVLRIETTGAVIRPRPQPEGDLLPGADIRRFAVQGFIDASLPGGTGITIAPLDAFVLRLDLDTLAFEALGNDQNYREVTRDQNGVTEFRFRYALKAHSGDYNNAEAVAWSRSVATPLLAVNGYIPSGQLDRHAIIVNPARAIAMCLKPADDNGHIIRLWEVGGQSIPISVEIKGYQRAFLTDLLERDIEELKIVNDKVTFNLRAYGFGCLRLIRL